MKAMVLETQAPIETSPLELRDLPVPEPGPGEILVRVSMCGLCHTDLHEIEGDLPLRRSPLVPGHQIVGRVERLGPGVERPAAGERVGAAWLNRACGSCAFCRDGRENLCRTARFTGWDVDGGYAEYTVLPADFVYPLPGGFSDREAAPLLCAGIVGYRALRLSGIEPGGILGLYGFGASAHVSIQVARHWNCRVFVFTRTAAHRKHALALGAEWAGTAADEPPAPPGSSIIFAPAGELVPAALERIAHGGTVTLAGIAMTGIPAMNYERHLYHEKILRSVANATRRDGRELIELAAEIPVHTDTTLVPLEEANEALRAIKESRVSGAVVLDLG